MIAKTGSDQCKYVGLLPIEPRDDSFCPIAPKPEPIDLKPEPIDLKPEPIDLKPEPIDLKPEPIDLKPEVVPFPHWQASADKRPRSFARVLIGFCTGVALTLFWQSSYGDAARERIAKLYLQAGWLAARPPIPAESVIAPATPSADQLNAVELDAVGQNVEKTTSPAAPGQEPATRSADQIATGQEQIRNADQTGISVDEAPATKASNVTVESQGDAISLHPAARLTEERPPQTLVEKGKPRSATSGNDGSCFASASAVLQNHPGAWPTWTFKAPGHEGSMCWYAAARPSGSDHRHRGRDHRREMLPKEIETVGTAENGLSAPFAPYGRGGSWEGGLP
jgi:hypothetical protein